MSFRIGQKIVSIRTHARQPEYHFPDECLPVRHQIYTVRSVGAWHPHYPDFATVRLVEIVNREHYRWELLNEVELFFYAQDFRPLQTRKTDISIFTAMLDGHRHEVPA